MGSSSSEAGSVSTATGGMKRPLTPRQNGLATNVSRHQARQRFSVRTLTPSHARRRAAGAAVMPPAIAVTSTTTAPR